MKKPITKVKINLPKKITLRNLISLSHFITFSQNKDKKPEHIERYDNAMSDLCGVKNLLSLINDEEHGKIIEGVGKLSEDVMKKFILALKMPKTDFIVKFKRKSYYAVDTAPLPARLMIEDLFDKVYNGFKKNLDDNEIHKIWLLIPRVAARVMWHEKENAYVNDELDLQYIVRKENEVLDMKAGDALKVFAFFLSQRMNSYQGLILSILQKSLKENQQQLQEKSIPKDGGGKATSKIRFARVNL